MVHRSGTFPTLFRRVVLHQGPTAAGSENGGMDSDHPPYPSALRLPGRRVVVVGGGQVAQRRVPALLAAGAAVVVVSPR